LSVADFSLVRKQRLLG